MDLQHHFSSIRISVSG